MKNILLFVFFSIVYRASMGQKDSSWNFISPENPLFQYQGRIDFSTPAKPAFCYPGVSISFTYEGPAVEIQMTELAGGGVYNTNFFEILLDGKSYDTWKMNPGKNTLRIDTSAGIHMVNIFKRTECSVGRCAFTGIKLQRPGKLLASNTPELTIEFIGDSYTCGYGNEISVKAPPVGNPSTGFHRE